MFEYPGPYLSPLVSQTLCSSTDNIQLRVGMSIGHHPTQAQHAPDMKKPDSEISQGDKEEAQRRIEGSGGAERRGTITKAHQMAM